MDAVTRGITRRGLLGSAAALSLSGFSSTRSQAATSLIVATYGGPNERILREQVLEAFDKANDTTTKLELGTGGRFIQKMLASRNRSPYDIVYMNDDEAMLGDDSNILRWQREGFGWWTNLGIGLVGALVGGLIFRLFDILPGLDAISISLRDVASAVSGSLIFLIGLWAWYKYQGSSL